ncbi:response regulator transcription factor [Paenibacillus sp.]|uniref:response regulator transcription factor n=1 Tax=Paenibacillus sp. TaxID=58172 RepID=UPI002D57E631|nr:response regulator [Paenibacillus sp.]HZG87937.1 response regulator [Paenibacillus sp.]
MYRLMIVDDEPIIVNGLHEYFMKRKLPDVEIVTAFSATEALSWLNSIKIDVVLSDIHMPGMDGMELLDRIEKQWPRCKVILLTGHDEFEYAHKALRSACVTDYILKTEGMDTIGPAVNRALSIVKDELSVYHQQEWLYRELPRAIAQLQRQLVLDLVRRTEKSSFRSVQNELDALKLPFKAAEPLLLISLFVEEWGKYKPGYERDLMLFGIGNITEELLGTRAVVKCVQYDGNSLLALIQPIDQPFFGAVKREELTVNFTHGTLETVQQVCRDLFGLSLSVAASGTFFPFENIARETQRLRLAILNGKSRGAERLTIVREEEDGDRADAEQFGRLSARYVLEKLQQSLLEEGGGEWSEFYRKLIALFPEEGPNDPFDRLVVLQALCKHCLVSLEELGMKDLAISQANLLAMLEFNVKTPWVEVVAFFQSLFEWVQSVRCDNVKREESNLIGLIHYYIQNHLHGDLSLSRIAREVSLNPSYLSRWYKQTCGKGLSDYIQETKIERGKQLLQTTNYKMHEISEMLGFTDPHYFFRFFKKSVGCTPQEYRNRTSS